MIAPLRFIVLWFPRILGFVFLVVLFLLIAADVIGDLYGIYHKHAEPNCYHYSHYLKPPYLVRTFYRTITSIEALWTAIASLVGLLALWGIYEQIIATHAATKETRRSVDAYISREIGYLTIHSILRGGSRKEMVKYSVVNNGPSVIHIIGFQYRFQVAESEGKADGSDFESMVAVNRVAKVSEPIGNTWKETNNYFNDPLVIPDKILDKLFNNRNENIMLILTLDFTYDSPFGVYRKRMSVHIDNDDNFHHLYTNNLSFNVQSVGRFSDTAQ